MMIPKINNYTVIQFRPKENFFQPKPVSDRVLSTDSEYRSQSGQFDRLEFHKDV